MRKMRAQHEARVADLEVRLARAEAAAAMPRRAKVGLIGVLEGSWVLGGCLKGLIDVLARLLVVLVRDVSGLFQYRGELNPWVKGSACLVLEFALPPFSPPPPSVVEVSK